MRELRKIYTLCFFQQRTSVLLDFLISSACLLPDTVLMKEANALRELVSIAVKSLEFSFRLAAWFCNTANHALEGRMSDLE
ncbi:hypothetical protein TNCT_353561 [Trichonephila clavata]|uniref:Uncharacterized protein n=1 Tax=Trichonephila clavata TaxID=2740835 RepID=A0A8X6G9T8_TRICU|nr:hypothetical protein TNCT_353561 [Trichonephila clavata]